VTCWLKKSYLWQYSGPVGGLKMLLKPVSAKGFHSGRRWDLYKVEKGISFHPLASETTDFLEDEF